MTTNADISARILGHNAGQLDRPYSGIKVSWTDAGYGYTVAVTAVRERPGGHCGDRDVRTVTVSFAKSCHMVPFVDGVSAYTANAVDTADPSDAYRLGAFCAAVADDADRYAAYLADHAVVTSRAPDGMLSGRAQWSA